ncbi:hypothetical protein [Algoriphagus boritolerans]|uniref:hypothetical protein n=1 Tax=Algoriphagus boritolerans TaxID=308111 RepID=UPI000B148FDD
MSDSPTKTGSIPKILLILSKPIPIRILKVFFELYLFSTDLPKLKVSKRGKNGFSISLQDIDFEMPVEVQTSEGIQRLNLGPKATEVKSTSIPIVDPKGWIMLQK